MRRISMASAAVALLACAGGRSAQRGGGDATPAWVGQGSGAINTESGKKLQGVGVISGTRDPKTRRQQADEKARAECGVGIDLLSQWLAKMSGSTKENASDEIGAVAKRAMQQSAQILDHWVTPDGTESALCLVDLGAFKGALEKVDGDERLKREMANNAERAFDQLNR
jgi:hypothetical protein